VNVQRASPGIVVARRALALLASALVALASLACRGEQSVLAPRGPEAEQVATLSLVLFAGGTAVLLVVVVLTALAMLRAPERRRWLASERFVAWGGLGFPVVVLTAALVYGLSLTDERAGDEPAATTIEVVGERWWWRVHYLGPDGEVAVASANEIRLPVGRPVLLRLLAADVIHSLWVPNLAGKLDMVPGHVNHLPVRADRPGVFRGQCAEYCGGQHAWMAFHVVALPPAEFDAWMARARQPAPPPDDPFRAEGQRLFLASGCGSCHTVRGTAARGLIGPDMTRVGERPSLAAGTFPNHRGTLAAWTASAEHLKPGNGMPSFGFLTGRELRAVAAYMEGLR
jgi:cytochrome c oxidase subunit 2